ncbi:hypothetical protein BGZ63DRAFT_237580 [Mariannaea sp. PMI_226]|nr:hypothetical protein BGZ63DRAFT_237580 [Mariannaea sp. PMI_226]
MGGLPLYGSCLKKKQDSSMVTEENEGNKGNMWGFPSLQSSIRRRKRGQDQEEEEDHSRRKRPWWMEYIPGTLNHLLIYLHLCNLDPELHTIQNYQHETSIGYER